MIKSPITYYGGKARLVGWILPVLESYDHTAYVEPFGGGASVLLAKRPGFDVYNDIYGDVVNLFNVIRDKNTFSEFQRQVALMPYSREFFYDAYPPAESEAFRVWFRKNLKNRVLPVARWTTATVDDELYEILIGVVDNDAMWNTVWRMFSGGEQITDGTINGTETGLLARIRNRIAERRGAAGEVAATSDVEAGSVALAVIIVSAIANGPTAMQNVKDLIRRIKERRKRSLRSSSIPGSPKRTRSSPRAIPAKSYKRKKKHRRVLSGP